jgi:hypothetical protein
MEKVLPKEWAVRIDLLKVCRILIILLTAWAYINLALSLYEWKQTHAVRLVQVSPFVSPLPEEIK